MTRVSAQEPRSVELLAPAMVWLGPRLAGLVAGPPRPALFLDRDGVVIEDAAYLSLPGGVRLLNGAAEGVAAAAALGAVVVVVSNQSGVGRGFYSWADLAAVDDEMARQLARRGAAIDITLYAGAAPGAPAGAEHYRKPAAGLFDVALRLCPIDIGASVMIGDREGDIAASTTAGIGAGVLIGSAQPPLALPPAFLPAGGPEEAFAVALDHLRRMAAGRPA